MNTFTILMYEDDQEYKDSFKYNIEPQINAKGKNLIIHHKLDGDSIESDLMVYSPNLIMIDHDLGSQKGDELIEFLDATPEFTNVILIYYSGGESLDDLKSYALRFKCHIQCFTKEGDDLINAILKLV